MTEKSDNQLNKTKNSLNDYTKYSALSFQMIAIILGGVFLGYKLDEWFGTKPVFLVVLSVLSVFVAIYFAIKDLIRKK